MITAIHHRSRACRRFPFLQSIISMHLHDGMPLEYLWVTAFIPITARLPSAYSKIARISPMNSPTRPRFSYTLLWPEKRKRTEPYH